MKKFVLAILCALLLTAGVNSSHAYDYPFSNPYVATVIGTPAQYGAPLPGKIKLKQLELRVFEDRKVPDVFWYQDRLRYSLAYQKERHVSFL